ncbi:hypothetical protein FS837_006569 [Tulasnella sp. UAMH 9824]|nr:hypothetical protein FS837_006569 [Tulasnella sp. UAMH 9824]
MKAVREINVPQEDVISQAILAIVDEVCKENGLDIRYSGIESTEALPLPRLPIIWDGLKAVKAQVAQQIDQLIAHLASRWNASCSINKLPVEVLVMIFKEFEFDLPHTGGSSRLLNLLLVCRAWYEVIMGSPQLWCSLDSKMPHHIAQLVIDRSRMLPLSVHWHTYNMFYRQNERDSSKLFELTIGNSRRIRSLDVRVSVCCKPDLRKLLEAPTPSLETLRVDATSVPQSLELLLGVVSSSQRLEVLHILDKPESTEEYRANALVVLSHLKELVLSNVPSVYGAAFLASVYTPSCYHVEVKDKINTSFEQVSGAAEVLDAAIWRPGNDQAVVLLGGTGSNVIPGTLSVWIRTNWIQIENFNSSHERYKLEFARTDTSKLAARLVTTLSQSPYPPAVRLGYTSKYPEEQPPVELLPWSELLETLSVRGTHLCRLVLRQLSERLVYELYEEDTALDGEALLSLVRHRWSGKSGMAEASRPASFEVFCWKDYFPHLWSLEAEIKRMLPCFKLIDDD